MAKQMEYCLAVFVPATQELTTITGFASKYQRNQKTAAQILNTKLFPDNHILHDIHPLDNLKLQQVILGWF